MQKYQRWQQDPAVTGDWRGAGGYNYAPMSYRGGGGTPNVTVNVASAHATPDEIKHAVSEGIHEANRKAAREMIARSQGAYA
jgi:hypothetical protein